jgi:glycerol-3-phosphate dehydrogenase (NAD(P)+)
LLGRTRQRVGILGAGAWGTAIAKVLAERGHRVEMWSHEEAVADEVNTRHANSHYLMGVKLPEGLKAVTDVRRAVARKDFLLIAVPSPFIIGVVKQILGDPDIVEGKVCVGVLSKGFVETSAGIRLITEAIEDYLPGSYKGNLVYISGPSHAEEVARGKITGLISASRNGTNAIRFRELLSGGTLVLFSSLDVRGVQICAAVKNVIAIGFGILDALKEFSELFGDNTESLLLASGLNEIQRIGMAMGATHPETFASLAGVGDLDVTCRSEYGRNRRLGREIILDHLIERYTSIEELIAALPDLGYFAEGVVASRYVKRLAEEHGLALPICAGVYRILNREAEPLEAVEDILRGITRDSAGPEAETEAEAPKPRLRRARRRAR